MIPNFKGERMKSIIISAFALTLLTIGNVSCVQAETTPTEKVQEVGQDTAKVTKKAVRATKDAVCAKGDVECAAQKAKHKLQNTGDEINDKANDVKKKVD
jgi:hypothetical protein